MTNFERNQGLYALIHTIAAFTVGSILFMVPVYIAGHYFGENFTEEKQAIVILLAGIPAVWIAWKIISTDKWLRVYGMYSKEYQDMVRKEKLQ